MAKPSLVVSASTDLFASFFSTESQKRLSRSFVWERDGGSTVTPRLRKLLASAEALVTTWDSPRFGPDLMRMAPRLRVIVHCGGEVKSRFAEPLFGMLSILNAPGPMAKATAELGAAFLLYCARNVDFYRAALRKRSNRIYSQVHEYGTPGEILFGREVAMIGFGRVGRALVDLLRGFEIRWLVYDPYAKRSLEKQYPVKFAPLQSVLGSRSASLLMLTAALTEETRGILNRKALAQLPDGAAVINVARGGLIDLQALTREVERSRLRCAMDVSDPEEPLPANHPLRKLPGAIVTPHVGGGDRIIRYAMAEAILENLERFFRGEAVENRVTAAMLARMT